MYKFCHDYVKPTYSEKNIIVLYGYRSFHCAKKPDDIYNDISLTEGLTLQSMSWIDHYQKG